MSLVPDKLMSHEQQLVLAFLKAKMWNTQSKQCYSKKQEFADFEVVLIFADQLLLIEFLVCVWVFGSVHEVQPCTPSSVFVPGGVISGLNFSAQFSLPLFFQSICLIEKCEVLNGKKGFFFLIGVCFIIKYPSFQAHLWGVSLLVQLSRLEQEGEGQICGIYRYCNAEGLCFLLSSHRSLLVLIFCIGIFFIFG